MPVTVRSVSDVVREAPKVSISRMLRRGGVLVAAFLSCVPLSRAGDSFTRQIESRAGYYRADIAIEAGAERFPEINHWRATVHDSSGEVLYRLQRTVPYDSPYPALVLFDSSGDGLLLNAFDGIVEFVDGRGNVRRRWRPFAEETPSYERILKCSVARNRVAFLVSDPSSPPARVFTMDASGTPAGSGTLPVVQAGEIFLSDDGRFVVAGGSSVAGDLTVSTSILAWEGVLLDTVAMDFRLADVSPGGSKVVLADARRAVEVDLQRGEHRLLWLVSRPEGIISALQYHRRGVVLVSQTVEFRGGPALYGTTRVLLMSPDGATLLDRMLEGASEQPARVAEEAGGVRLTIGETTTSLPIDR
jgi:hypothetical protein